MVLYIGYFVALVQFVADFTTAVLGLVAIIALLFKRREILDAFGVLRQYMEIETFSRLRLSAERLKLLPCKLSEEKDRVITELAQLHAQLKVVAEKYEIFRPALVKAEEMLHAGRKIKESSKVGLATEIIERIMKGQVEGYAGLRGGKDWT